MKANKIVWKRMRSRCVPSFLYGYTGKWVSFEIHPDICGSGFDLTCLLPGVANYTQLAASEDILIKNAQDIFDKWFEGLMEVEK